MKILFYFSVFILISVSIFFNLPAHAGGSGGSWEPTFPSSGGSTGGGGAGGSWGNSDGFGGNGGSGGSSAPPSECVYTLYYGRTPFTGSTPSSVCSSMLGVPTSGKTISSSVLSGSQCSYKLQWPNGSHGGGPFLTSNIASDCSIPPPPPDCPSDQVYDGSQCVPKLQCPAGYKKEGDKCVWQCPVGYKDVGGSCVKDDQPEDCDPAIQECDENGEPVCDPCSKLQELISNNQTMINNDNRVISLTETLVSNQNTTNNNINNVNNSLSVINNNMSTINNNINNINSSIQNVITAIEDNKPDFDTSGIEVKLDAVITAIQNNNGVGEDGQPIDLTEILRLLNEIDVGVKDGKFDDTQLNAYFDEIIQNGIPVGVDFTEVTDRQDDQTGLLKDIKKLLMPTNEAGDPDFGIPEVGEFDAHLDPWAAIRGFDINQNMINAQAQCPSGEAYSFTVMGKTFDMPMTIMCNFLGQIGVGIMFLAYMSGAFIIVKGD